MINYVTVPCIQAKLKEAIVLKQKEKDGALQHAELLQQQVTIMMIEPRT